jgi:DNA repair protein RecN (Recombination protein N)
MLRHLSIRDVVLIDQLDLEFTTGLVVLTGETGAGKSILLDALGLALGARADASLVRHGAEQAVVSASFELRAGHDISDQLAEHAISADDGVVVLRRILGADGRSRAFVNDQPVSVGLQRRIGGALVEIHGQFDSHGLLDPATHIAALDIFAGLTSARAEVASAHAAVVAAREALAAAEAEAADNRAHQDALRAAAKEIDLLAPQIGEEEALARRRETMQHAEQLINALGAAAAALTGDGERDDGGAERDVQRAVRALEKVARLSGGGFEPALATLERAAAEIAEAVRAINAASRDIDPDPAALDEAEERLFALRAAARKHGVAVDALPALQQEMARRLVAIADESERLADLARALEAARRSYIAVAERLSKARRAAAAELDAAVMRQLPPLRLDKAHFATLVDRAPESAWGAGGIDRVGFVVATNPGSTPGPLNRIASGGELSRFMLALKVAVSASNQAGVLIFDEVDAGVGGATAAAVGERLARLAGSGRRQLLVVTHSPQVAAVGDAHWHISKRETGEGNALRSVTVVRPLDAAGRREEIARMLAGAAVTDEARAAAARLLDVTAAGDLPARAIG